MLTYPAMTDQDGWQWLFDHHFVSPCGHDEKHCKNDQILKMLQITSMRRAPKSVAEYCQAQNWVMRSIQKETHIPLIDACRSNDSMVLERVLWLLNNGALPTINTVQDTVIDGRATETMQSRGHSALWWAIATNTSGFAAAKMLLLHGARIDTGRDSNGAHCYFWSSFEPTFGHTIATMEGKVQQLHRWAIEFHMEHERYIQFLLGSSSSTINQTSVPSKVFTLLKRHKLLQDYLHTWKVPKNVKVCIKDLAQADF